MSVLAQLSVSFTGRCLALSRADAEAIVTREGGKYSRHVNETTDVLVIGSMGWPLQRNGRLTRKLDDARRLQRAGAGLVVESEDVFLRRFNGQVQSPSQRYTLPELASLLALPPQRLLYWVAVGLIRPLEEQDCIAYFSFTEVARCRALCQLSSAGVNGQRMVRALRQLQVWLPDAAVLLDRLAPDGRSLSVRDTEGRRIEPNGQFLIDFGEEQGGARVLLADSEAFFNEAVSLESAGKWREAEAIYRRLLEGDRHDVEVTYNLANVLAEQERCEEAAELYQQAVELDPQFIEAWNNLGSVLSQLERHRESLLAFRRAHELDRTYPAALFGLARAYEESGRMREAKRLWRAYLEQVDEGECADYARSRCVALALTLL
jgi:tetratricopeptide (TPR) repeat protein